MKTLILKLNQVNIFLAHVCITIVFAGCCQDQRNDIDGKQCEQKPDEYYTYSLGESKEYMYFKPGTWWVYKNIKTNLIDTITVYQTHLDTIISKGTLDATYQRVYKDVWCVVNAYSSRYPFIYFWYNRAKNPDASGPVILPTENVSTWVKNRSEGTTEISFASPLKLHYRSDIDLITLDTNLQIGSKIYYKVQVFKIDNANAYYDILDERPYNSENYSLLYYSPNYGLIKQTKYPSKLSIELIECNIIQ